MAGASSWSFEERDFQRIDRLLQGFLYDSNARCALLVDRTGQLVTTAGEKPDFDSTAFASLAAADFSANDQLASMIGENEFSSLFHQGEKESMYLADVARRVILVVLFDNRTTLGMIRIKVKGVVRELAEIFREMFDRSASAPQTARVESAFVDEAEDEIDRLFGDL
ncbi:roadblock/LC7 domain-containing protein [Longimicrobium sp.]|uniref:roadblock/LC7 domain-containing protein n=1 Tax=Longimicrobium sp. TaxID=2029185 RepID=UPI002B7088A4|nr:roadblock/LC7 domain-containing protein [Longimicrobium sp.]HSU17968.1 roadblock/LC7 domain-containing protein [Longimicrobium sp.]